ncbi:primosomal protein N' [Inmirania thermothiophila]|uniref:Replication restart protein PriA n=1 Tax=Inmirania thermothiophila TaxID=1750597 RepID=A0A3N1Y6B1_9GAMM|nr:primosomal protein N' [Inmirania thermothiophila]ROR34315.1 replication restart DNA helicase PriA [Inmirania thermothiophila]
MTQVLKVAVPAPLAGALDYLPPRGAPDIPAGVRVRVPLGRRAVVGVVVGRGPAAVVPDRLRPVRAVLDERPVLDGGLLDLVAFAAGYYHAPLGEVLALALPAPLRKGAPAQPRRPLLWRLTAAGRAAPAAALARAPRQRGLLERLRAGPVAAAALSAEDRRAAAALAARGWAEAAPAPVAPPDPGVHRPALTPAQGAAVAAVRAAADRFAVHLLEGVTGSGKTEVYLRLAEEAVARGGQVLVLVPEIALTPQTLRRFRARFGGRVVAYHSGLAEGERLAAWAALREGEAAVALGTRSAVWLPLPRLALVVVDEEHDPSYKQQEGPRYHARDLAVWRARRQGCPVVLGSATPALETLHNARRGRFRHLRLAERAGEAVLPRLELVDLRREPQAQGIARRVLAAAEAELAAGRQVLFFLNRRGYAPTLLCTACGWIAGCDRCSVRLTVHGAGAVLRCHHCGARRRPPPACPACGGALLGVGRGTERVEALLRARFEGVPLTRIDRDRARRRGALERLLAEVAAGGPRIVVGTQLLAKGHHFPDLTLVGVLNADQGLFGADFRGPERAAQLIVQVAGRAGRGRLPGRVLIQTHAPEHPLLQRLVREGYAAFAAAALAERAAARLPPFAHLALLRVEAVDAAAAEGFAAAAAKAAAGLGEGVEVLGPAPAPIERRAGRHRWQVLLRAARRSALQRLLARWAVRLEGLPGARRVRWGLDVDPLEMA